MDSTAPQTASRMQVAPMSLFPVIRSLRRPGAVGLAVISLALSAVTLRTGSAEETPKPVCIINYIGHETTGQRTRVILHANIPIDYRGGSLRGSKLVLDLANVEISLPSKVVELGSPEVSRVVIGPEINREGDRLLKIRLLGVRASSHKVETKGNELYIDLTPVKGARDREKGMPKVINNDTEVMASARGLRTQVDSQGVR